MRITISKWRLKILLFGIMSKSVVKLKRENIVNILKITNTVIEKTEKV